jgi:hypothetical protein
MNACLAIGIEKTAGGEDLPGAVNGARQMAAWAEKSGYQTEVVTDENDIPVDIARVRDALLKLLPSPRDGSDHGGPTNPPDRLIVYFAGHGLQADTSALWLLSDSQNSQEAIGISPFQDLIASYGVPQVAIIADACRSPTVRDWNVRITPHQVLPLGPYNMLEQIVDVDLFQAVPQYQQAYMLRSRDDAPARCIFTGVLMEALHGAAETAFSKDRVTSDSLVIYLRKEVEPRAAKYKVPMKPQVRASWLDETNVYLERARLVELAFPPLDPWPDLTAPAPAPTPAAQGAPVGMGIPDPPQAAPPTIDLTAPSIAGAFAKIAKNAGDMFRGGSKRSPAIVSAPAEEAIDAATQRKKRRSAREEKLDAAFARKSRLTHFESECGVTLTGADFASLAAGAGRAERDTAMEGGFRLWDLPMNVPILGSTWTLAELGDGRFVGGLAIRGFLTDHVIDGSGSLATNLRRVGTGHGYRIQSEAAIKELLRGDLSAEDALQQAAGVRNAKHEDPVLGVIAAYLYHAAGEVDSIRRMAAFYHSHQQPVPYDIALLARVPALRVGDTLIARIPAVRKREPVTPLEKKFRALFSASEAVDVPVAGRFPIMRGGWSILGAREDDLVAGGLGELSSELKAAPFTTLSAAGGQRVLAIMEDRA